MAAHKFIKGDRVMVRADRSNQNLRSGIYEIVRAMPEDSEGFQYRAKSVLDTHERMFREAELVKA